MNSIPDQGKFKGKKILITGACGFIGSHLLKRMLDEQADVYITMRNVTDSWRIKEELNEVRAQIVDMKDTEGIDNCIKSYRPDYVFNLAAYGVDSGMRDYIEAIKTNVLGTVNILNSLKATGCKKLINVGSCAEYGDKKDIMREDMSLEPVNIYGSTKAASTIIAHQIARENGIDIVTLRPFGVFGETEEPHKVFSYVILSILDNKAVNLTRCEQYRDYCYVENIVDGLIMAAQNDSVKNEVFNIGTGTVHQLKYYIDLIFKCMNTDMKPNYGAIENRKDEMWYPQPDISKIKTMLDWDLRVGLEEGIARTVSWFKNNKLQ